MNRVFYVRPRTQEHTLLVGREEIDATVQT